MMTRIALLQTARTIKSFLQQNGSFFYAIKLSSLNPTFVVEKRQFCLYFMSAMAIRIIGIGWKMENKQKNEEKRERRKKSGCRS